MKKAIRVAIGGKAGACCWLASGCITAACAAYFGPSGMAVGAVVGKVSWLPYLWAVKRQASK